MKLMNIKIQPLTAFVTPLKGDTLFGQLCWALRHNFGESRLKQCLAHYKEQPFLVVSDPFAVGYLPRPTVPSRLSGADALSASERKADKKRRWIPVSALQQPLSQWQSLACSDKDLYQQSLHQATVQAHNTLSRLTGMTGEGQFAPFQIRQNWYALGVELDLYIVIDEQLLSDDELHSLLTYVGNTGYGKEASTGLGKFNVVELKNTDYQYSEQANAWLTLAPSVVSDMALQIEHCYYQPFTRFGRHGDQLALSGQPFKKPLLMLDSGAILVPEHWQTQLWVGQAVGGSGELSKALPATVHQGYTPVLPVFMSDLSETIL